MFKLTHNINTVQGHKFPIVKYCKVLIYDAGSSLHYKDTHLLTTTFNTGHAAQYDFGRCDNRSASLHTKPESAIHTQPAAHSRVNGLNQTLHTPGDLSFAHLLIVFALRSFRNSFHNHQQIQWPTEPGFNRHLLTWNTKD